MLQLIILLKHRVVWVLANNTSGVFEFKWACLSTDKEVQVSLDIVILYLSISASIIKIFNLDFLKLINSLCDSLLHQKIIDKHKSIMSTPLSFDGHLNHKFHVSLAEILVQNPLLCLIWAVWTRGVHSSDTMSSRIHQREIVEEIEYIMWFLMVIYFDKRWLELSAHSAL